MSLCCLLLLLLNSISYYEKMSFYISINHTLFYLQINSVLFQDARVAYISQNYSTRILCSPCLSHDLYSTLTFTLDNNNNIAHYVNAQSSHILFEYLCHCHKFLAHIFISKLVPLCIRYGIIIQHPGVSHDPSHDISHDLIV